MRIRISADFLGNTEALQDLLKEILEKPLLGFTRFSVYQEGEDEDEN